MRFTRPMAGSRRVAPAERERRRARPPPLGACRRGAAVGRAGRGRMRPCRARKGRRDLGPVPGPPAQHGTRTTRVLVPGPRLGEKGKPSCEYLRRFCNSWRPLVPIQRNLPERPSDSLPRFVALVEPDNDVVSAQVSVPFATPVQPCAVADVRSAGGAGGARWRTVRFSCRARTVLGNMLSCW